MPNTAPKVIEVSAGLVFRNGKLLITQRRAQDHLGGLWEFPGGKRHDGETFEQCLARELQEELDIEVAIGKRIETIRHDYPGKSVLLQFFCCQLVSNEPRPIGCAAVAWVTRTELDHYAFPAADARLLDKLRASEELWGSATAS